MAFPSSILAIVFYIAAGYFLWLFFRSRGLLRATFLFVAVLFFLTALLDARIVVVPFLSMSVGR